MWRRQTKKFNKEKGINHPKLSNVSFFWECVNSNEMWKQLMISQSEEWKQMSQKNFSRVFLCVREQINKKTNIEIKRVWTFLLVYINNYCVYLLFSFSVFFSFILSVANVKPYENFQNSTKIHHIDHKTNEIEAAATAAAIKINTWKGKKQKSNRGRGAWLCALCICGPVCMCVCL